MSEFPPAPGQDKRRQGHDNPSAEAALDAALLDAVSEAFSSAFIVYDRNDHLIFASRSARQFLPLPASFFAPGTRLRDVLGAAYDLGLRHAASGQAEAALSREEWLTRQIAAHWKERYEIQSCDDGKRWTRFSKRRLPSGFGFCVMSDITEQKRREEQWRADIERVQLTEEILDNLAHPVFVQDRNLQLVAVNKVFCSAISVGADNALGGTIAPLFEAEVAQRLTTVSRQVLETGVTSSLTLPMRLYGDPPRPILAHVQRVGTPGRYLIVASLGEVGSGADLQSPPVEVPETRQDEGGGYAAVDGRLIGRKALLITGDREFEARALEILQLLGLDSCCVRNDDELDAFLSVARSVGVVIDLAIVDVDLDMQCLELLQAVDIDYLTLAENEIATDLAFTVLDRLTALQARPSPADDWEITTEDVPAAPEPAVIMRTAEQAAAVPVKPAPPRQPSLVLVAEDNEINQIVFSQILEGLGYAYRICADGETAVSLCTELKPAIVLMDVTLPGLNGFEAARRIRQSSEDARLSTPIIGVLAQAFDRDREACFASGMNDVILKPLSPDVVDQAIRRLVPDIARLASTA
ncbi:two-component sensor histidine kinase transcriptional regulatory protein [Agrobacterium albertimagni AOL15]|uniref:Two-component sensor histidine kinase transcriptional regulatory protein n=1 Tax=Agrobacterium albertimagni AOL15 TaxID=1156935 RepID=K2Q658_9HYPH|nr:response regulator [Agrobacterium albertimagni]EKF59199.1 two-component sensor histidine kinase transcriptional regulatory protein [Agrobacterium albertimagni AOL15]